MAWAVAWMAIGSIMVRTKRHEVVNRMPMTGVLQPAATDLENERGGPVVSLWG